MRIVKLNLPCLIMLFKNFTQEGAGKRRRQNNVEFSGAEDV